MDAFRPCPDACQNAKITKSCACRWGNFNTLPVRLMMRFEADSISIPSRGQPELKVRCLYSFFTLKSIGFLLISVSKVLNLLPVFGQ